MNIVQGETFIVTNYYTREVPLCLLPACSRLQDIFYNIAQDLLGQLLNQSSARREGADPQFSISLIETPVRARTGLDSLL